MSSGLSVLSVGHPPPEHDGLGRAREALLELHRSTPIERILFAQAGLLNARMAPGGGHDVDIPCVAWAGEWAIARGERPWCTGVDRLRAVLADATALDPRPTVIVWGPLYGFSQARRRVRAWDVPQAVCADEVLRFGLDGWGWVPATVRVEGRLVRLGQ